MWPINQKRVFGACCAAVVWNRKRDGLDIKRGPHSALEELQDEPRGALTVSREGADATPAEAARGMVILKWVTERP